MVGASGSRLERWIRVMNSARKTVARHLSVQPHRFGSSSEGYFTAIPRSAVSLTGLACLSCRMVLRIVLITYLSSPHRRVQHYVTQSTRRPIGMEVVLDECHGLTVQGIFNANDSGRHGKKCLEFSSSSAQCKDPIGKARVS
jgi:hypothetical protein